jgi:hypothetical protein
MENVNIVFQALDYSNEDPSWNNSKIVHTLNCKPLDFDVSEIVHAISVVLGCKTIRYTRLALDEKIDIQTVNRHSGGYYQAWKFGQ